MNKIVHKKLILFDVDCYHKEEAINVLVELLEKEGFIHNQNLFMNTILKREAVFPTSIGKTIAIPHSIHENVLKPCICFGRLKRPVLWDKEKGEYVTIVILIAIPKQNQDNIHIQIISHLMRHLMHDNYIERLLISGQEEIFGMLKEGLEK